MGLMDMLFPFGGIQSFVYPGDSVFIKIHCQTACEPYLSENVDPGFLEGLIGLCEEAQASKIFIGENPKEEDALRIAGIEEVAYRTGAELVDLSKMTPIKRQLEGALFMDPAEYYNEPLLADVFISVPKLKTRPDGCLDCAAGNLKSLLGRNQEAVFNKNQESSMVDVISLFRPDLTIVDGIFANHRSETVSSQVVFAGIDTLALDTVAASLMGVDLDKLPYLALAARYGLGTCDSSEIAVFGADLRLIIENIQARG